MMLNIPRSNNDTYYRYKMPAPRVKQENGHKTVIMNLKDMALALNISHQYILKFMGYELGCNVSSKEPILLGRYDEQQILKCLDKYICHSITDVLTDNRFIEHYILCSKCHYPEALLKVEKKDLAKECDACGNKTAIKNGHKVNAYILKNFEPQKALHTRVIPNSKDLIDPTHGLIGVDHKDDQEDEESFEEEKKEVEIHVSFADIETELICKAKEYYQQYEAADDKSLAVKEIVDKMKKDVPRNKIPYLLFNGIFDINIAKNISKNGKLLKELYEELETSDSELDLLLNLESFLFVKNKKADFERLVPTILKLFQDEDLFNDEFIIDWDDGKLKSKFMMDSRYQRSVDEEFKEAARPFIDWVKTTEEEEDEDEDT